MTFNAADRKSIRAAEKAADLAERNRGEVLTGLMSSPNGRRFIWDWLDTLQVFGTPVDPDPHRTYFLLGEQNAGKRLLDSVFQWCPDLFILAMRESNERRSADRTRDIRNADRPDDGTGPDQFAGSPDGGWDDQGSEPILGSAADEA